MGVSFEFPIFYYTFNMFIFMLQKETNDNNIHFLIDKFKCIAYCVHKCKYFVIFQKQCSPQNFKVMPVSGVTNINNVAKTRRQSLMGYKIVLII